MSTNRVVKEIRYYGEVIGEGFERDPDDDGDVPVKLDKVVKHFEYVSDTTLGVDQDVPPGRMMNVVERHIMGKGDDERVGSLAAILLLFNEREQVEALTMCRQIQEKDSVTSDAWASLPSPIARHILIN